MFVFDAHCDTLMDVVAGSAVWRRPVRRAHRHTQAKAGGVGAQVFAAWIEREFLPGSGARARASIDAFYREVEDNPDDLAFVRALRPCQAQQEGKIGPSWPSRRRGAGRVGR